MNAAERAQALLAEVGLHKAWGHSTAASVDAHLTGDAEIRDYWKAVQFELARAGPRPGASELDIYRSARLLINQHGSGNAARIASHNVVQHRDDLLAEAVWLRIADAVQALAQGRPGPVKDLRPTR